MVSVICDLRCRLQEAQRPYRDDRHAGYRSAEDDHAYPSSHGLHALSAGHFVVKYTSPEGEEVFIDAFSSGRQMTREVHHSIKPLSHFV